MKTYTFEDYMTEQAQLLWIRQDIEDPLWNIDWFMENYLNG